MSAEPESQSGSVETKAEYEKNPHEFTRHWLQAIDMAGDDEKSWREDAEKTLARYRKSETNQFNVLYANTQTTVPALYNSEPSPDIRRRFGDKDEAGQALSQALERAISIQCELYDFDACMQAVVKDRQLPGRGVTRVRVVKGEHGSKHIECEPVLWDDFRRGPAKQWRDVPWVGFRAKMTREELVDISPKHGRRVKLDAVVSGTNDKKAEDLHDMFKRATVWEVWDKAERKIYFFAESFPDAPLAVYEDVYKLRDFFCIPRPLYAVETTDTLTPVCEFMLWKPLADEVDNITARISGVVKVMKLRGIYDGAFETAVRSMSNLGDGELAPAQDAARAMQQGGIEKAVWLWPVEQAIEVVKGLYEAREQAKQALYEMTGVADIMRGQTEASETLGAQQIKAQWGSLRLQEAQREVQRYARDIYRIMADLIGEVFEPAEIAAMTGIQLPPQAVQLLKSDLQREFNIEIETDSTIRADLTRAQENVAGFVTGFGGFIEAVGPAVQAGMMPPQIAVKLLTSFARNFKLGREAETALDEWTKFLEQQAQNPQPQQPDPKVEAEKVKAQAVIEKTQMDSQAKQAEHGMKMEQMQQEGALKQQEHQLKVQELGAKVQAQQVQAGIQQQQQQADLAVAGEEHALRREELALTRDAAQQQHGQKLEVMDAQTQAKIAQARAQPKKPGDK